MSVIAEAPTIFASNVVAAPMLAQQADITSVTAVVDNLPGVSVQEGDAYGFDDWSSNVAVRGFQTNINEAQIGTTIDGFPNGTSDYWSGSKANRFIDPANLGGVEVSQGTADIASRSVEALGGTFNFTTDDPARERTYTASATLGENAAERYYLRVDTGALFGGETYAWLSAGHQQATDWVQGAAQNERDHLAAKLVSSHGRLGLTSYFSHDDIQEDVYQRMYSAGDFEANPRWDRLVGDWPGVPYLNQFYRRGWRTRRKNTFGYLVVQRRFDAERGRLLSPAARTRRLAAAVHRGRDRRRRRPGIGARGRRYRAGRRQPRIGLLCRRQRRRGGAGRRLRVELPLQLLRLRRPALRPRLPSGRHRGAVVPAQPLRQGAVRPDARRGVVHRDRRGGQLAAGRALVRGLPAIPRPRLAPDSRPQESAPQKE